MKRLNVVFLFVVVLNINVGYTQTKVQTSSDNEVGKNYLGTSVFVLSSLIPNDDTYFFEIDYGHKFNPKSDLIFGLNIYKYTAPMSGPWDGAAKYPGTVLSYGVLAAYQFYFWKDFFIDQMINPLVLNYNNSETQQKNTGFMLLLATRIGYHFDFTISGIPFYLEVGGEISYWPVNSNVPKTFKVMDSKYSSYTFSPALQFGFRF